MVAHLLQGHGKVDWDFDVKPSDLYLDENKSNPKS